MAMYQQKDGSTCTEDNCYNELNGRIPSSGYVINTTKSYCNLNGSKDNNVVIENVNGKPLLSNLIKGDKCYLYFDKIKITNVESLVVNSHINNYSPTFSNIATTNEGIYQTSDGMYGGTTYYWRGAVENNHVIFAEHCWRIVRINGDKTIRLIYNGDVLNGENKCFGNGTNANSIAVTSQAYNPTYNASYYVGWTQNGTQRTNSIKATPSNAMTQTKNWYEDKTKGNLTAYESKIAEGKFCNDRDVTAATSSMGSEYVTSWSTNGTLFAYAGPKRLYETYQPTFSCPSGDVYTLKTGLITADEVEFAGGNNKSNDKHYLYNGQHYWTMSPSVWSGSSAVVFAVNSSGILDTPNVNSTIGLRPVINLKSDVIFSSGDGTISSPYVVS